MMGWLKLVDFCFYSVGIFRARRVCIEYVPEHVFWIDWGNFTAKMAQTVFKTMDYGYLIVKINSM